MSQQENKAAVHRFWKGFNDHNLDVWDEVCTPDYVNHDPSLPVTDADLHTIKEIIGQLQAAFPDLNASEEDLVSEGDKIVVRRTFRGTHKGEFMGVAPSGRKETFTGVFINRLKGGKIAEHWALFDARGLLQQISDAPTPVEDAP